MSDSERIIRLLKTVERRTRGTRILHECAATIAFALLFPVFFKVIDLFVSFRTATVSIFFLVWALGTLTAIIWRTRGLSQPLQRVAANIDTQSSGQDQLKTAYWFIRNPKESPWVQLQIQRAAESARAIQVNSLYPRRLPRASYMAIALILLLGVLNFLPLPWNYNWLYLQGAPAFNLDESDRAALQKALELLREAEKLQQTDLSERLAEIIQQLQTGNISKDQLSRSLSQLQQSLGERNLDAGQITDGLERVARALDPSALTKPVAAEIFKLDLKNAAEEVRAIEKNLSAATDSKLREMAERFQEASDVAGQGLEQLSKTMADSASAMRHGDTSEGQRALEETAKELERLQRVLESQRLRSEAGQELASVQESVGGTPGDVSEGQGQGEGEGQGEGKGEGQGQGQGEGQGTGQGEGQGEGQGIGQGEGQGGEGQESGEGQGEGDQPGSGGGQGGKKAGLSGPFPMHGDPTSLETQLDKEPLPVHPTRGSRPETIEEASQKERSRLDYRNVKSNLTPAQKDTLNQDPIPFEQRQFVKEYIESLRP